MIREVILSVYPDAVFFPGPAPVGLRVRHPDRSAPYRQGTGTVVGEPPATAMFGPRMCSACGATLPGKPIPKGWWVVRWDSPWTFTESGRLPPPGTEGAAPMETIEYPPGLHPAGES